MISQSRVEVSILPSGTRGKREVGCSIICDKSTEREDMEAT